MSLEPGQLCDLDLPRLSFPGTWCCPCPHALSLTPPPAIASRGARARAGAARPLRQSDRGALSRAGLGPHLAANHRSQRARVRRRRRQRCLGPEEASSPQASPGERVGAVRRRQLRDRFGDAADPGW